MTRKLFAMCFVMALGSWASTSVAEPGRGAYPLCYVWAHSASPTVGVPYTPSTTYSYNTIGKAAANTVTKTAVGTYSVTCKGVGGGALFAGYGTWGAGGHVQVTAYGAEDADYCKVQSWSTGAANFTATVKCYNAAGSLSDNRFDLLFVW